MAEWLVAAEFGEGPPAERARLNRYTSGNPKREELRVSLENLWERMGELDPPELAEAEPTLALLPWYRRHAIAAALAPLVVLAGAMLLTFGFTNDRYSAEIAAGPAERRLVSLPDGSNVSLSTESLVSVALEERERHFVLRQGEALFDVAHDPGRPFIVEAGEGRIIAVGTAFNVRLGQRRVIVTVTEGAVRIEAGGGAAGTGAPRLVQLAKAGEQVIFGSQAEGKGAEETKGEIFLSPPETVDAERFVSWATGTLRFDGEPLREVIAEVNRYSSKDLRLTDPSLAEIPIFGVLNIGDVDGLKSIVADIQRIDAETVSRKIEVVADRGMTPEAVR